MSQASKSGAKFGSAYRANHPAETAGGVLSRPRF